ncbi:MAG TPA: efflux RND transporter periplasmic adaptor subunit [Candidatus Krumholzibacteria bacterium]|nr:efflux RND transporter periplasmic adaptor subunit [Candidatus Krumholzibacteria bacterium]HPD71408.1 efflux RND transporter periplasmic adaptor subunit [Candidatus Krumholzibacteria bacterium]HRY41659.1 efflux RND transporter periplasmic adaptor subunit [Candidatus Krumholzibacteria bacterium]
MARNRKRLIVLWSCLATAVIVAGLGVAFRSRLPFLGSAIAGQSLADSGGAAADTAANGGDPAVPVEVAAVERRAVAAFYRSASSIQADRLVAVTCRAAGRVRTVAVEEGDWVEAGQVLAELENDRQRVDLRRAELNLEDQRRKLSRTEKMLTGELISQEEFDAIQVAHDQAEAERDLARIALEETFVKAPFAGQITVRNVVAGQQVQAGQEAYTVADFTPMRVRVHLPEPVVVKIRVGEDVILESEGTGTELVAAVERISPVVDPGTGTVVVTLRLPDTPGVRVGGFVKARLTTDRKVDVLAVPKLALVDEGGLRSVFVAEADTVRKVEITTGLYDETHIEVTGGLEEGWSVVTLGRGGLRTGSRIEVLETSNLADLAVR